jgi:hypothetical protein
MTVKRARQGMRVQNQGYCNGLPIGATGTVASYPSGIGYNPGFIFVDWDNHGFQGVFKRELKKIDKRDLKN